MEVKSITEVFTQENDLRATRTTLVSILYRDAIEHPEDYENCNRMNEMLELISFLDLLHDAKMRDKIDELEKNKQLKMQDFLESLHPGGKFTRSFSDALHAEVLYGEKFTKEVNGIFDTLKDVIAGKEGSK
jgi:hypothetical protein